MMLSNRNAVYFVGFPGSSYIISSVFLSNLNSPNRLLLLRDAKVQPAKDSQ